MTSVEQRRWLYGQLCLQSAVRHDLSGLFRICCDSQDGLPGVAPAGEQAPQQRRSLGGQQEVREDGAGAGSAREERDVHQGELGSEKKRLLRMALVGSIGGRMKETVLWLSCVRVFSVRMNKPS